jgi:hypothetical protein
MTVSVLVVTWELFYCRYHLRKGGSLWRTKQGFFCLNLHVTSRFAASCCRPLSVDKLDTQEHTVVSQQVTVELGADGILFLLRDLKRKLQRGSVLQHRMLHVEGSQSSCF